MLKLVAPTVAIRMEIVTTPVNVDYFQSDRKRSWVQFYHLLSNALEVAMRGRRN